MQLRAIHLWIRYFWCNCYRGTLAERAIITDFHAICFSFEVWTECPTVALNWQQKPVNSLQWAHNSGGLLSWINCMEIYLLQAEPNDWMHFEYSKHSLEYKFGLCDHQILLTRLQKRLQLQSISHPQTVGLGHKERISLVSSSTPKSGVNNNARCRFMNTPSPHTPQLSLCDIPMPDNPPWNHWEKDRVYYSLKYHYRRLEA